MVMLRIAALAALAWLAVGALSPSHAMSTADCSAKYQAAKKAGTLNGMKWNDFRKKECTDSADAAEPSEANTEKAAEPAPPPTTAPGSVVFPTRVDPKYAKESPGKARMHTCLDQYRIDKDKNALGGLKWIQKGGGYYSICNSRLKGNN